MSSLEIMVHTCASVEERQDNSRNDTSFLLRLQLFNTDMGMTLFDLGFKGRPVF
jgi:hypothetical protein